MGTTIYTVHAPNGNAAALERTELVKEGFCWPALFWAPLWMVYRAQWWGLVAYFVGLVLLSAATAILSPLSDLSGLHMIAFHIVVAMHANDWRRWRLEAAGLNQIGVVSGRDLDIAEARWFAAHAPKATATGPGPARHPAGHRLTPFATPFDPV